MPPRIPRLVQLSYQLYRFLAVVYPCAFRQEFGEEMAQTFRDCCRDAYLQGGPIGLLEVWGHALLDLAENAIQEYAPLETEHVMRHFPYLVSLQTPAAVRITCSFCGEEVSPGWPRCRYCGVDLFPCALHAGRRPRIASTAKKPVGYIAAQLVSDPDRVYEWSYGTVSRD